MTLGEMITVVQTELDDSGVHYLQSGVSGALTEGQQIVSLLTLCYERLSTVWSPTIIAYQQLIPVPTDCIVPIYVRDKTAGSRIHPAKFSHLSLHDTTWWATTGTKYEYYSLFNPCFTSGILTDKTNFSLLVYPTINTTSMRVEMTYAANPPTLQTTLDVPKVPHGSERTLIDYAMFLGTIRMSRTFQLATDYLQSFFNGITRVNEIIKSRYPEGRDFEPEPIEQVIERVDAEYIQTNSQQRRRR